MRFTDTVALVTGANHGIGRAIAEQLAREGAHVALGYGHDAAAAHEVAAGIHQQGRRAIALQADVRDPAAVAALVEQTEQELGPIGVLFNVAGIVRRAAMLEVTPEAWDEVMDVNAKGTFLVSQAVSRRMLERQQGAIVNIASMRGVEGAASSPHYAAAKAAVIALTRSFARALAPWVRVNAVSPGYVSTRLQDHLSPEQRQAICDQTPLARFGTPAEIACTALFLASPDAGYVTGQNLLADGGRVMG